LLVVWFASSKNTSHKPIASLTLTSEMFLAPQDLRRPFNSEWSSEKPILPGQEQTVEKLGIRAASAQSVLGWVFFPYLVKYEDRTSKRGGVFYHVWRDPQQPDLSGLPPRQIEMNPD
jgi:hypothetical protein